jgi:IS5 family transposase
MKTRMRQRFRRRAAIEPVISHLKHDYRLARCFLKGHLGDAMNLKLAAAAWNLNKWMREVLFWLFQRLANQTVFVITTCPHLLSLAFARQEGLFQG